MKTKASAKSFLAALVGNTIAIVISLIAQKIFIDTLGSEYLGLNALFTNIISMLSVVELGFGSAVIYSLYKPVARGDQAAVRSLMRYYRNIYRVVAVITLVAGLILMPFLSSFVGETNVSANIYIVYLLFVLDAVFSYLLSYRRSILYANQENYIISVVHVVCLMIMNALQILTLVMTRDFYMYLVIRLIMRVAENVILSLIAGWRHRYLAEGETKALNGTVRRDITKRVKGLFFHKIGTFMVLGTDSIIISHYLGLAVLGLYSNYLIIINALNTIFGQAIVALTPSVGHLLVEDRPKKSFEVFRKVRFMTFWIATFTSVGLLLISAPFVTIWLGSEYVLGIAVVAALVFNFFQKMMRNAYIVFKEAAGIYHEDRFVPIVESVINIIVSVMLVNWIGLPGVFIGTIISGLALWCYSYPKYVYRGLFRRSYWQYARETAGYILLFVVVAGMSYLVANAITFDSIWMQMIYCVLVTAVVPNVLIILGFARTENFRYFVGLFKKLLRRKN